MKYNKDDLAWSLIGCSIAVASIVGITYSIVLTLQLYGR